jgi:hypothetical protein
MRLYEPKPPHGGLHQKLHAMKTYKIEVSIPSNVDLDETMAAMWDAQSNAHYATPEQAAFVHHVLNELDKAKAKEEIEDAKAVLRKYGYHTEVMWNVADVRSENPSITDDNEAHKILNSAMRSTETYTQIWENIKTAIEYYKG